MRWCYFAWLLCLPMPIAASVFAGDVLSFLKRQWAEWYDLIRSVWKL